MKAPLSIYIHWPFCKSKCPYCDFNSHVRDKVEHARWRAALLKELAHYAQMLPDREVVSIFFGGGTPSLMEPQTVAALIETTARHWPVAENIEVTLEANPTSVEAGKLREFHDAGVNRASLGVQATNAADLRFLGRQHSAGEALTAVAVARDIFPRMSFDLIYARPGQTLAAWKQELTQALAYANGHMSLYQLTIEENTAFHAAHKRGELPVLDEETAADMYALTASLMQAHGMPAYEISNYAAPGQESRHNLAYWRGDDYIGIGPGAHGRWRDVARVHGGVLHDDPAGETARSAGGGSVPHIYIATENIKSPERWLEGVETAGSALQAQTEIPPEDRKREMVMMGLRLAEGIYLDDWEKRTGLDLRSCINRVALQQMREGGFLEVDDQRLRTTPKGALMLSSVTGKLLA